jgi:hypothetical protein
MLAHMETHTALQWQLWINVHKINYKGMKMADDGCKAETCSLVILINIIYIAVIEYISSY